MSKVIYQPPIGVEAQHVYLDLRAHTRAYALLQDVLPLSYELHVGRPAGDLIARSLERLRECTTEAEVNTVFAESRAEYKASGFAGMLTSDKEGGWRRGMAFSGLDAARGHVVDIGNPNNKFGDCLLRNNPDVTRVTGVDERIEPTVMLGDRLHFAHQEDPFVIPLPDDDADVVAFRLSLHHMVPSAQVAMMREAVRVLRPGGEILIIEDSWIDGTALSDNAPTMRFRALSDDDKIATLKLLDVSSCLMVYEKVPYPMSYRPVRDWEALLRGAGCATVDSTYWGFSMFTLYAAPMAVIRAKTAV